MVAYTLYDASIGQAKDALDATNAILSKIEASPVAGTIATAKIHDDMLPFSFQIHFLTVLAFKMAARLTGQAPPEHAYKDLDTIEQMRARVAEARAAVDAVSRDTVNAGEETIVKLGMGPGVPEKDVKGWQYAHGYAIPNIFFHLTTAYNIARKEGVDLGKKDFITSFIGKHLSA